MSAVACGGGGSVGGRDRTTRRLRGVSIFPYAREMAVEPAGRTAVLARPPYHGKLLLGFSLPIAAAARRSLFFAPQEISTGPLGFLNLGLVLLEISFVHPIDEKFTV